MPMNVMTVKIMIVKIMTMNVMTMKIMTTKMHLQVTIPNAALLGAVGLIQTLELPESLRNLVAIVFVAILENLFPFTT